MDWETNKPVEPFTNPTKITLFNKNNNKTILRNVGDSKRRRFK